VAVAIDRLLREPRQERAASFAAARQALSWERAAEPLVRFCRAPQRAPDRMGEEQSSRQASRPYYDPMLPLRSERDWLASERDYWRNLAEGYANGRLMRTLDKVRRAKRRLFGG
jgi:hypothetical protein